ncbi:MAG: hypothetical protein A2033_00575 [Bacteroidetes bacterium GWA2_31_9]|nr:MAG: hypothetical protein A2033_00575 [Bacteroidetes bacterium GWA2_31_9]
MQGRLFGFKDEHHKEINFLVLLLYCLATFKPMFLHPEWSVIHIIILKKNMVSIKISKFDKQNKS